MIGRRLPDLGPRGEGWFAIQVALFGAVALAGLAGPAWTGWPRVAGLAVGGLLIAAGGLLAVWAVVDLRDNLTAFPRPLEGAQLVEAGPYGRARHPIYGGLVVAAIGWALATASPLALGAAIVLELFFELKSRREEVWLSAKFAGYESYRRRTRRFVPFIY